MYDHCYSHRLGEAKEGWKRNFQQQELSAVAYKLLKSRDRHYSYNFPIQDLIFPQNSRSTRFLPTLGVFTPSPKLPPQCDTPDQIPSPANVSRRTLTKLCPEVGDID
ncbi:unnamed protein product [Timema podura]|uniref:Uncharacterized protein n=1 Tax=Timema podura TaxID=61482 RepID=A0ABN7PLV4_TIMPD|nr:unnamed protein product [Timema podura]